METAEGVMSTCYKPSEAPMISPRDSVKAMNHIFADVPFLAKNMTSDKRHSETHPFLRRHHSVLPPYHPVTPTCTSGFHIHCTIFKCSVSLLLNSWPFPFPLRPEPDPQPLRSLYNPHPHISINYHALFLSHAIRIFLSSLQNLLFFL